MKCDNPKNQKNVFAPSPTQGLVKRFSVSRLVSLYGFVRRKLFTIRAAKTYDLRPRRAAAAVAFALVGIVVFFQFAPEKATRGTFEAFAV